MTTSAVYMAEQISERLVGGIIQGAIITPDDGGQRYGFRVSIQGELLPDGKGRAKRKLINVWVDCDAESNGPGWLSIE